ncbi:MAG: hypothetical protein IPK13_18190 [Deltaproteobacteria bacterium]|nr:hypothetical protein [Deltaproteobacteria bacterium]
MLLRCAVLGSLWAILAAAAPSDADRRPVDPRETPQLERGAHGLGEAPQDAQAPALGQAQAQAQAEAQAEAEPEARAGSGSGARDADEGVGAQGGVLARLGLGLYAASLGVLVLCGGAALLRFRLDEVPSLALLAFGVLATGGSGAILRAPAVLAGAALAAIVHSGFAATRRAPPAARIRVLLSALLLVGAMGALLAMGAGVLPLALRLGERPTG